MDYFFCAETLGLYPGAPYGDALGKLCVRLTEEQYRAFAGRQLVADENGFPQLASYIPQIPTSEYLCSQVDTAADAARRAVAGDPLRAVEYANAATEAQAFAAADYQGTVPPMVAAWAINGRTPQQAADSILAEAAQYNAALVQLRTVRLQAKEQIRALMAANQVEQAQQLAAHTIASIEAAVAGIGNNLK